MNHMIKLLESEINQNHLILSYQNKPVIFNIDKLSKFNYFYKYFQLKL